MHTFTVFAEADDEPLLILATEKKNLFLQLPYDGILHIKGLVMDPNI